jgi:uncharacterized GH25 family protein
MIGALAIGLFVVAAAAGHELYVVPADGDPSKVAIVFGHGPNPDPKVKAETWKRFEGLKLQARTVDGKVTDVKWKKAEHSFEATIPAGTQVVFGQADYGVFTRGTGKPTFVRYFPKAIVGAVSEDGGQTDAALQLVAKIEAGSVRFRVFANGQPAAGVTVEVTTPGQEESSEATTDEQGLTPAFMGTGRYTASVRQVEARVGEANGQKYEQISQIATLVVDVK